MDLDDYVQRLEQGGLRDRVEVLMAAVRPSVRLLQRPDLPFDFPRRCRIGGDPELAPDAPWPTGPDGRHLAFVAQIDLAAMPGTVTHPVLPADGWLHVFYDASRQPWGSDPADRGGWAITYTAADVALERRPVPDDQVPTAARAVVLEPVVEDTIVPPFSADARRILTDAENWAYSDAIDDWLEELDEKREDTPVHRLLGHPDTIQSGDIQTRCQLASHGIRTGDGAYENDPAAMALADDAADWHLLLQFDSDYDHTGIDFGDSGRIYLAIRDQDLAARRWDRTWLTLQCY